MNEDREDRIEKLNENLNSRTRYSGIEDKRTPVKESQTAVDVEGKWQSPGLDEMLKHEREPMQAHPLMKRFFIFSIIFFVITIGIAAFVFTGGANFVSSKNVDINIVGPTIISAGEVLKLGVSVSNENNADLEVANLSIQYPQGSRNPLNTAEPITFTRKDLGVIEAGDESINDVGVAILGTIGEVKELKFSVEYKVKGSNATFYKDKIFEVTIGNAPVTLTVGNPQSVTSGGTFTTTVSVSLDSTEVLKNVVLKAEYPYGYSVIDSTPKSASDNNLWALGDMSPGMKKTVTIRGQLVGENQEERTFRFYVGVSDSTTLNPTPRVILTSTLNTIAIERPSIDLGATFNGEEVSLYVAPAGRSISTYVRFKNNLSDRLLNPRLEVTLTGSALDKSSVNVSNNGVYDSSSSRAIWNPSNLLGQSEFAPGDGGGVSLSFASLQGQALTGTNNDIALKISLTGTPAGAVGQQPITVTETRTVRISSQVNLSAKVLRSLGPFINYGPVPPKAGEESSYTVVLNVGNTRGDVSNTLITARLGPNVKWLAAQSFVSENINYDSASNTVTWDLGTLSSGTGFSSPVREVSFQVALTPTLGQVGTTPVLVSNISLAGRDNVTNENVTANHTTLTTRLPSDPAFIQGDDIVVK